MRNAFLATSAAVAFGGADQYLGSFPGHPFATGLSLLSAPWLLVAFFAGWTETTAERAAAIGVWCTLAALIGYWAMTLSPIEGAQVSGREVLGLLASNSPLIAGAACTGPLFGWLGYRWRTRRDTLSGLAAASALLCEPVVTSTVGPRIGWAHVAVSTASGTGPAGLAEMAAGLLFILCVVNVSRRPEQTHPRSPQNR